MCLQVVLGISCFRDAVGEGNIDTVELVPHFIGRCAQQDFYFIPEFVRGRPLALGAKDVVVCKL